MGSPGAATEGTSGGRFDGALGALLGGGRRGQWRRTLVRRVTASLLAGGAVLGTVALARTPQGGPLVPVVVAARDLPAGQELQPADLLEQRRPRAYAPSGSESSAALVGRRLSGPVGAGEVLTSTRIAGAGLLAGRPEDEVAVHVPLADPGALAMVRAGDRVDVLAGTGETVAAAALVLAVRGADAGTGLSGGVGASLGGDDGGLVLAVTAAVAGRIASAPRDEVGGSSLTVVLRGR